MSVPTPKCVTLERFEQNLADTKKLKAAVFGDGFAALGLNARITIQESQMEKLQHTLSKAVWLCLATFLAVVGDLIVRGLRH